jgi:hypothetical protein
MKKNVVYHIPADSVGNIEIWRFLGRDFCLVSNYLEITNGYTNQKGREWKIAGRKSIHKLMSCIFDRPVYTWDNDRGRL